MKKATFGMAMALAAISTTAMAGEYKCKAQALDAYFVFDDGPGGMDHLRLDYQGKQYALVVFDKSSGQIEVSDSNTPDGRYDYDGLALAVQLTGDDKTVFVFDATRPDENTQTLQGKVTVTSAEGQERSLALTCRHL
jgi:hypothetical protein